MILPEMGGRRCRLFVLPGGDSPRHKNRSGPAGTRDAGPLPGRDTAPSTGPARRPAGCRRSTTAGTACPSGRTTCARRSSCGSRSAASAPRGIRPEILGTAPGPRWWTTSSLTGETGASSSTRPTTRACARPATTARRPENRPKNGEKIEGDFESTHHSRPECLGAGAWGRVRPGGRGEAEGLKPSPHPGKVSGRGAQDRRAPSVRKNFPTGSKRDVRLCQGPDSPRIC